MDVNWFSCQKLLTDLRGHHNETNIQETTAQMACHCGVVLGLTTSAQSNYYLFKQNPNHA